MDTNVGPEELLVVWTGMDMGMEAPAQDNIKELHGEVSELLLY